MKSVSQKETDEALEIITRGRPRTNLLRGIEQRTLAILVKRIPRWIVPDMLTFIGFLGSVTILLSFILGAYIHRSFLLLGAAGFAINWFGDSLDGRTAIYRNQARKWYGFSIDLTMDWISTIMIGWGYIIYAEGFSEIFGFGLVVLYGWSIITTLVRYIITEEYAIDSGLLGPTEVRIILSAVMVGEVFWLDSIKYSAGIACIILFFVNISDTRKLVRLASKKDKAIKEARMKK